MESLSLPELLLALKQSEESVYQPAMLALSASGKNAVPLLIAALDTADKPPVRPLMRPRIFAVLRKIAEAETFDSAVQMLLHDSDPRMRTWAVHILRDLEDNRAAKPLIAALADPDLTVRETVIFYLGYLHIKQAVEPLLNILEGSEQRLRIKAAEALGNLDDPQALNPLLETLKDPDPKLRSAACRGLGGLAQGGLGNQEVTRSLLDLLKIETDAGVRSTAIHTLEFLKDRSAVPDLLNYLSNSDQSVRLQTIRTLGELKDVRAIKPLVEILKNDEDNLVRAYAAGFLGKFEGQMEVIEPLRAALADSDGYVRMNAVSSLTELNFPEALEAIRPMLDDENPGTRWWACRYLEKFGDERALPALEQLENTDENVVRKNQKIKEAAQTAIAAIRQRTEKE